MKFSQAEMLGFLLLTGAGILLIPCPQLAPVPLLLFVSLCFIAPFCPQWGFYLSIISRGKGWSGTVFLTFDDGPSPETTAMILRMLKSRKWQATFFVVGDKAIKYPELLQQILAEGHSLGNHSWRHDNLLMFKSCESIREDIGKTEKELASHGVKTNFFRAPAGITGPRLKPVVEEYGLQTIGFSCRAFDGGNKRLKGMAGRLIKKVRSGDIILLHDVLPADGDVGRLERELMILFDYLEQENYQVRPLSELVTVRP